jgi:FixJ family two-component response regulator
MNAIVPEAARNPPTVFVIDDDRHVREALEGLLLSAGLQVEVFSSPGEFASAARQDPQGCLVLDIRLPGRNGLDFFDDLRNAGVELPVIFLSGHADVPMSVRAIKSGAVDVLTKPVANQNLLDAIEGAMATDLQQRSRAQSLRTLRERFASLTPREREVMALVVEGRLNKQIAFALGLSEVTVKIHRGSAMRKMDIRSLAELVRAAERLQTSPN